MRIPSIFSVSALAILMLLGGIFSPSVAFATCKGSTVNNEDGSYCSASGGCDAGDKYLGKCDLDSGKDKGQCCIKGPISDDCSVPQLSTTGKCKPGECGEGQSPQGSCSLPTGGLGQCCFPTSVTTCKGTYEDKEVDAFCMKSCDPEHDIQVGSCAGGACCYPKSYRDLGYFDPHGYEPPFGEAKIPEIIAGFITQILPLIGSLFFIMFLWGGFQWFSAAGDEGKVKKARATLVNAVIGITIVVFAYSIVSTVVSTFATGLGGK